LLKTYDELRKVDVSKYTEKREGFDYLNWAKCIDLLRKNGAEKVYFEPIPDDKTGNSLRMTEAVFTDGKNGTNRCYETRIKVVIDDKEYFMQTPVMNGKNPVKDNSMNQNRVWTSMCRAFVKCVAINTGLGFDLWLKEESTKNFEDDIPEIENTPVTEVKKKLIEKYAEQFHINIPMWLKSNGTDWEHLTEMQATKMLLALKSKYGDMENG
jgi:hypothetical protein